jgi:acetyl esterase
VRGQSPKRIPFNETDNAAGYLLRASDMLWFWNHCVPAEDRNDPRAVPARASNLAELAPAFVQTADYDPLRDEAEGYAERMSAAGVVVKLVRYPGVVHGFMSRWHTIARAEIAHGDLAAALRAAFEGSASTVIHTYSSGVDA